MGGGKSKIETDGQDRQKNTGRDEDQTKTQVHVGNFRCNPGDNIHKVTLASWSDCLA